MDADGDLDLAVANDGFNHLYENTGGDLTPVVSGDFDAANQPTRGLTALDADGTWTWPWGTATFPYGKTVSI